MNRRTTVEELMTSAVISVRASDTVEAARSNMQYAEIRHIPVVDEHGHVIGMVSTHDLHKTTRGSRKIVEIMSHPVVTVRRDTPAHEAAAILRSRKIGALPVVDPDGKVVGIVTETDFLTVAEQALGGHPSFEPA